MEDLKHCDMEQTNVLSKDAVLAELISMGFEFSAASGAVEAVGQSVNDAVDFILAGNPFIARRDGNSIKNSQTILPNSHSREECDVRKNLASRSGFYATKQSLITEKFQPTGRHDESGSMDSCENSSSSYAAGNDTRQLRLFQDEFRGNTLCTDPLQDTQLNWEQKAEALLRQRFGYKELKCFQKEALKAWAGHQDCLVLAATGSGKSLCFQLPALLTGKVVVVVSPLISLMHDQCLKLARNGVSACFLGSGQVDKSIENRAMAGLYDIIYVCPETLLRVIGSFQKLAESRGITLFAIDEVHCVSKWGHDFRPDYRRLSVLREKFQASNVESVKHHIPIMALTATATHRVRADIMSSLGMKPDTKIVLTSFFRPNLRFSVHHSQTSCSSSYKVDFQDIIDSYTRAGTVSKKNKTGVSFQKDQYCIDTKKESAREIASDSDETSSNESDSYEEETNDHDLNAKTSLIKDGADTCEGHNMTVEYLEDELDERMAEDFDVTFGEFEGSVFKEDRHLEPESGSFERVYQSVLGEEHPVLGLGPSIIYTPTRKETVMIAKFLSKSGVKAAAYHAKLPKNHLRQVHEQFHQDKLQVVVATIAFGMGIDKANVRRIIHYGWPQSLESYYQEAGRAGRDGLLADCSLYVNMKRLPSLLPSKRNAEQTQNALNMLSECFRYGVSTTCCRAKILVQYFGEDFIQTKCGLCDVCVNGPPNCENLSKEAGLFLRVLVEMQTTINYRPSDINNKISKHHNLGRCSEKVLFRTVIQRLTEQCEDGGARTRLWWRGFGRMLQDIGFIRDIDNDVVQNQRRILTVKYPEPTVLGLEFLKSCSSQASLDEAQTLHLFSEGDMLQAMKMPELSFQRSREWGRDWADPEIRQQRLKGRKGKGRKRKRVSKKSRPDSNTVRGRLSAKLSRKNH